MLDMDTDTVYACICRRKYKYQYAQNRCNNRGHIIIITIRL